ncbi:uncharacterized protein LOC128263346 [Drosophila gunungcola]|uniref:uncharacterized protein LOC128263346 n=1 Tax=Drosophila gunungcola TaxID=103775 RepID=UPI0022DF4B06|nr:uncharacterized protein LOC128263346 [Drosophila gunungcola]
MSDEDKKQKNTKDSLDETGKKRKSAKDGSNTEASSVSFSQKDDEANRPQSSSGPKVGAKPKKSSIAVSGSAAQKEAFDKGNLGSQTDIEKKKDLNQSTGTGKSLLKSSEDEKPQTSSGKGKKPKPENADEGTSTRRRREPFDSFDKETYLADMMDYERSSELDADNSEKKQSWEPDSSLRRRFSSNQEINSALSFQGEEEETEIDSTGSLTMLGSTYRRSKTNDDRSLILTEVFEMGKLQELKDQQALIRDFLKQPRTIDEIKGSKVTGTGKSHVDEIKWKDTSSDDDGSVPIKHRGTNTKISRAAQRVEEESLKKYEDEQIPSPEPEKELESKRPWTFPIAETFSEIPGERQPLGENQKVQIGKRNNKIRSIGVNTDISRKTPVSGVSPVAEEPDFGAYHDDGKRRDIGQVTDKVQKHRKKYVYKTESDDNPIDIGPLDDRAREIGVNTKVLPKSNYPRISAEQYSGGGKFRDVGSNTDKHYKPIDDGTEVFFMNPIMCDNRKLNKLIVDAPPDYGPYKMPMKNDNRAYYKGCEYHFPGRTGWRRLFYNRTHGKYELRRPSHYVYTVIFATCYILFVLLFSMAWFDCITDVSPRNSPVLKMTQPSVTFTPIGPRTNPNTIAFDPRNNTEVMEKYAGIMALLNKYGGSGQSPRFGTCNAYEKFGYPSGEPCVFLKVNRIIGFKTEPYTDSDELVSASLDEVDFAALKSLLVNSTSDEDRQNRTWITCRTDQDKNVQIEFHPEPAFRTEHTDIEEKIEYVINNDKKSFFGPNDLNRIVALKIKNLNANERVHVTCKMWARNIKPNQEGYGQVSFYVLLANEKSRERVEKVLRHHDSL